MILEEYSTVLGVIFLKDLFEEIVDIDFSDSESNHASVRKI